jgi:Protein of unknown function (DUF3592).
MIESSLSMLDMLAVVVIGSGALIAAIGLRQYRHLRAVTQRAVSTTGTVQQATTQLVTGASGSQSYVPVVDYEYRTPTAQQEGTTVYPGESRFSKRFGTEAAAETAVEDYDPGGQTTVYYDPDNPAHSFLIPDPQTASTIATAVIGLAILMGGLVVVV